MHLRDLKSEIRRLGRLSPHVNYEFPHVYPQRIGKDTVCLYVGFYTIRGSIADATAVLRTLSPDATLPDIYEAFRADGRFDMIADIGESYARRVWDTVE